MYISNSINNIGSMATLLQQSSNNNNNNSKQQAANCMKTLTTNGVGVGVGGPAAAATNSVVGSSNILLQQQQQQLAPTTILLTTTPAAANGGVMGGTTGNILNYQQYQQLLQQQQTGTTRLLLPQELLGGGNNNTTFLVTTTAPATNSFQQQFQQQLHQQTTRATATTVAGTGMLQQQQLQVGTTTRYFSQFSQQPSGGGTAGGGIVVASQQQPTLVATANGAAAGVAVQQRKILINRQSLQHATILRKPPGTVLLGGTKPVATSQAPAPAIPPVRRFISGAPTTTTAAAQLKQQQQMQHNASQLRSASNAPIPSPTQTIAATKANTTATATATVMNGKADAITTTATTTPAAVVPNGAAAAAAAAKRDDAEAAAAAAAEAEAEAEPEIDIVINNVVCSFSVGCHLNLRDIALNGFNVEYRRENGMVTMKLRRPYTTASIWSSGRITCTGATSEQQAKIAARRYSRCLHKLGFRVRLRHFRVVNVLGTCSMPWAIKIVNFSERYKKEASYEPELHPGVTYKLRYPKATLKIFSTGSVTVTAASVANVQAAIEHIFPLVYEFRKKRSPEEMELLRLKQQNAALAEIVEIKSSTPASKAVGAADATHSAGVAASRLVQRRRLPSATSVASSMKRKRKASSDLVNDNLADEDVDGALEEYIKEATEADDDDDAGRVGAGAAAGPMDDVVLFGTDYDDLKDIIEGPDDDDDDL